MSFRSKIKPCFDVEARTSPDIRGRVLGRRCSMKHVFKLASNVWHKGPLSFAWDDETGELSGPDAAVVEALARQAVQDGAVPLHPEPGRYPVQNPLRNPAELAALLGYWWQLPPELQRHYPPLKDTGVALTIEGDGTEKPFKLLE
jgi:hypothetical protein